MILPLVLSLTTEGFQTVPQTQYFNAGTSGGKWFIKLSSEYFDRAKNGCRIIHIRRANTKKWI